MHHRDCFIAQVTDVAAEGPEVIRGARVERETERQRKEKVRIDYHWQEILC